MIKRAAIYTRKSTEEGLDQAFNSLDAQREACEAYIVSQKHEGWGIVKSRFDDGGLSGGNLERPGLQALLDEIDAGRIDIVVVYKVDRLTRSLADFAKLVERFDKHEVSFVSVTQAFNTSNSMGRLTLNVLLSFAQFEREVGAERVRDKIAASRKKGIWTGGNPPLGYDNVDKKLIVAENEAAMVREIYAQYTDHGSVPAIIRLAREKGWVTKRRANSKGGKPLSRGPVYHILKNPIYAGLMRTGGKFYEGEHKAIIDRDLWDAAQTKIDTRTQWSGAPKNSASPLAGILYWNDQRMTPDHATKKGWRYRYYVTDKNDVNSSDRVRLKAEDVEDAVAEAFTRWIASPDTAANQALARGASAAVSNRVKRAIRNLRENFIGSAELEKCKTLRPYIRGIALDETRLALTLDLKKLLKGADADDAIKEELKIEERIIFKNRRQETRLILGDCTQAHAADKSIVTLLARAYRWKRLWFESPDQELKTILKTENGDTTTAHRTLRLAFLAPDIMEALINGKTASDVTPEQLRRISELPADWNEQRRFLGQLAQ